MNSSSIFQLCKNKKIRSPTWETRYWGAGSGIAVSSANQVIKISGRSWLEKVIICRFWIWLSVNFVVDLIGKSVLSLTLHVISLIIFTYNSHIHISECFPNYLYWYSNSQQCTLTRHEETKNSWSQSKQGIHIPAVKGRTEITFKLIPMNMSSEDGHWQGFTDEVLCHVSCVWYC